MHTIDPSRQDTEDGIIVNPWCPRCLADGETITETTEHQMYTCPHVQRNHLQLARTINNHFRNSASPVPCQPLIDADALERITYNNNLEWDTTPGWTSSTSDKHGRETVISKGPPGTQWENMKLLTSWAHNIIRHCTNNPDIDDVRKYTNSISLGDSIDPFLLQGIATAITADSIHSIIPHNPFMTTQSLCSTTPSTGITPTVVSIVGQNPEWKNILQHLTTDRPWVLLATDDQKDDIAPYIQQPIFQTLPADSTAMWGYSFWQGTSGLFPETWDTPINIYTSSAISEYQKRCITQAIYARCLTETPLPPTIEPDFTTSFPETPPTIANILSEHTLTPVKLQLLCGILSQSSIDDWHLTIPRILHQKLYRNIHRSIVEHQHNIWTTRNNEAHPPDENISPVLRNKKRRQFHQQTEMACAADNTWITRPRRCSHCTRYVARHTSTQTSKKGGTSGGRGKGEGLG